MRAGSACAAQQTLSAEAASVLKHSLSLARRRGHAQVTPLHVAATLLTSRASLLRRACVKSSRTTSPTTPSNAGPWSSASTSPSTASPPPRPPPRRPAVPLQRPRRRPQAGQAHQRRGCVEQQQPPPLIAVKVELEQLVLSILDDPSVSRVMREAGFSSAAVKSNLEDANMSSVFQCYNNSSNSGGIYTTPNSPQRENTLFWQNPFHKNVNVSQDVKVVLEVLLSKRRKNIVIVGDSSSVAENVVAEIMGKVERGDVPEGLKPAHFIRFHFSSAPLRLMKREEVEMNIADLKRKVDSFASAGVIIYTGDLKWTVEIDDDTHVYSPVQHLIAEMANLLSLYNNNNNNDDGSTRMRRVWLMATANYQTYIKCQTKQQPLDVLWALQAVSVPTGGLGLSLNATSDQDSRISFVKNPSHDLEKKPFFVPDEHEALTCCPECKSNYEKEASFKSIHHKSFSSHSIVNNDAEINGSAHLPFWLKPHAIDTLVKDDLIQLRRKYNKLCQSLHKGSHNPNNPISVISNQSCLGRDYSYLSSYSNWTNRNSNFFSDSETISFANNCPPVKTNQTASSLPRFRRQQSCHIDFSFSNATSKYHSVEPNLDSLKGADDKEVKITLALGNLTYNDPTVTSDDNNSNNNENLVMLFQENVPWQSETVALILEALSADSKASSRHQFILIKGNDNVGKRRFAVGIAKFMFGSSELLFRMNMRKNAHGRAMLEKALRDREKLVVLIEDVDYADCEFAEFLDEAYERNSGRAIFILTVDDDDDEKSYEKSKGNVGSVIQMRLFVDHGNNKRKADWDLPMVKNKSQRSNEIEQVVSSKALDLNIKADDQDEMKTSKPNSLIIRFLEKIKNHYVLNMDSDQEARAKDMFLSKLKRSFKEVNVLSSLSVEEKVLEEVLRGSGLYLNSLFEEWLKEVFRTSLQTVDSGEGEKGSGVRLSLGGKGEICPEEDGFMGTCLPKIDQAVDRLDFCRSTDTLSIDRKSIDKKCKPVNRNLTAGHRLTVTVITVTAGQRLTVTGQSIINRRLTVTGSTPLR
ncbi:hypothetical protein PHJA_000582000 [Phtheirospermum japonicum]|uniref:Clp R domain-containing protein n=1 Tax=Phtheirospermum japonicum TaxID=374723 RepID=A0A830BDY7_9LAMI|nr:hypothetical protein PHJA_000582000 [Phtheirospermum japonicum]